MAKWVADRSTRPARRLRGEALPVRGVKWTCCRCGTGLGPGSTGRPEGSKTHLRGPETSWWIQQDDLVRLARRLKKCLWNLRQKVSSTHTIPQGPSFPYGLQARMGLFEITYHDGRRILLAGLSGGEIKCWGNLNVSRFQTFNSPLNVESVVSPATPTIERSLHRQ